MIALSLEIYHLAPDASVDRVRDVGQQVGNLAGAIQALSQRLHSSTLELLGLGPGVAVACRELASALKVEIDVRQDGSTDGLTTHAALAMLRVLQEALQNAARHSGVRHFVVLEETFDELRCS
jgi:signal transduction histidine kinase